MPQSIETTALQPPGKTWEFNIWHLFESWVFSRPPLSCYMPGLAYYKNVNSWLLPHPLGSSAVKIPRPSPGVSINWGILTPVTNKRCVLWLSKDWFFVFSKYVHFILKYRTPCLDPNELTNFQSSQVHSEVHWEVGNKLCKFSAKFGMNFRTFLSKVMWTITVVLHHEDSLGKWVEVCLTMLLGLKVSTSILARVYDHLTTPSVWILYGCAWSS